MDYKFSYSLKCVCVHTVKPTNIAYRYDQMPTLEEFFVPLTNTGLI